MINFEKISTFFSPYTLSGDKDFFGKCMIIIFFPLVYFLFFGSLGDVFGFDMNLAVLLYKIFMTLLVGIFAFQRISYFGISYLWLIPVLSTSTVISVLYMLILLCYGNKSIIYRLEYYERKVSAPNVLIPLTYKRFLQEKHEQQKEENQNNTHMKDDTTHSSKKENSLKVMSCKENAVNEEPITLLEITYPHDGCFDEGIHFSLDRGAYIGVLIILGIISVPLLFFLIILLAASGNGYSKDMWMIWVIAGIYISICLPVAIARLNDAGESKKYAFILFIPPVPIAQLILLIYLAFLPSKNKK